MTRPNCHPMLRWNTLTGRRMKKGIEWEQVESCTVHSAYLLTDFFLYSAVASYPNAHEARLLYFYSISNSKRHFNLLCCLRWWCENAPSQTRAGKLCLWLKAKRWEMEGVDWESNVLQMCDCSGRMARFLRALTSLFILSLMPGGRSTLSAWLQAGEARDFCSDFRAQSGWWDYLCRHYDFRWRPCLHLKKERNKLFLSSLPIPPQIDPSMKSTQLECHNPQTLN